MMSWSICGLLLVLAAAVRADDGNVLVLDDSNFDSEIKLHDILLVEFYAPWCGHCERLEPEYNAAADQLIKDDPPIRIAKIDCTNEKHRPICGKYDVKGYPTVKLFKGGKELAKYKNKRSADEIVRYMRTKSGPASKLLETVEAVEKFVESDLPVAVGFFKEEDSEMYRVHLGLAGVKSEDFKFGHSFNQDVLKKYGHTDKLVLFRPPAMKSKFEEQQEAKEATGDLTDWFNKNVHGLVGLRTSSNQMYFPNPLVTVYYGVDYQRDPKGTQYWRNRVMKVAKDFKNDFTFAIARDSEFGRELEEFGLKEKADVRVALKNEKGQKFPMEEKFSKDSDEDKFMDTFRAFLQSYKDGKLTAFLKSEPVPEDNSAPVKVVVAKNFDDIVNDASKDVLIEFYAPWCGHCKSLEPKYNELAEKLKDETNVVIAKMDATANDVPQPYNVRGFPTIYFAPKGSKDSPKQYQGGREVKDFMAYLAKESKLTGFDGKGNKKDEL